MKKKSVAIAYILWFFSCCGVFGFHRLYVGKKRHYWLWVITLGYFYIGSIIDLFTLRKQVNAQNGITREPKRQKREKHLSAPERDTIEKHSSLDKDSISPNVESNRIPFPFSGKGFYKVWERTDERVCLFEERTGIIDFSSIHTDEDVTFEAEPDNPKDPKAVKVLINNVFVGYLFQTSDVRRQVYKSDLDRENVKFSAKVSYIDRDVPEIEIRFALYQRFLPDSFDFLGSHKLVYTSKKIDEYESMQDNYVFSGMDETDAIIQIEEAENDEGNSRYIAYAPHGGEIGELPASVTQKLEDICPTLILGILEEIVITDTEKSVAKIKLYCR